MGADFISRIGQGIFGSIIGRIMNRGSIERAQQAMPTTQPSQNIQQQSAQQRWQGIQQGMQGAPGVRFYNASSGQFTGSADPNAIRIAPWMLEQANQQLEQYRDPATGEIDWRRAQSEGALQRFGIQPSDVNRNDLMQQGMSDIDAALASSRAQQQRALQLGEQSQSAYQTFQQGLDQTRAQNEQGFQDITGRANQVMDQSLQQFSDFRGYQQSQMDQLQSMIGEGLGAITAEKQEALASISENLARDIGASTSAARAEMSQQLSNINSDPNLSPEQRIMFDAQVGFQTAARAATEIAPIQRMYRELETNTRVAFGNMMSQFRATGVSVTGGLAGQQQAVRGEVINNLSRIGSDLTNTLANANASRNLLNAQVDSLRLQAQANKDEFMLNLLPHQQDPFAIYSPLLQSMYGLSVDEWSLQRGEEQQHFSNVMTLTALEQGLVAPWMNAGLNPPAQPAEGPSSGTTLGAAGISAAGGIGGAVLSATIMVVGFCIGEDSLIEGADGPIRLKNLKVGDRVLDADGNIRVVIAKHFGHHPGDAKFVHVFIPDLGSIVASPDHVIEGQTAQEWLDQGYGILTDVVPAGDILLDDGSDYIANGLRIRSLLTEADIPVLQAREPEHQIPRGVEPCQAT